MLGDSRPFGCRPSQVSIGRVRNGRLLDQLPHRRWRKSGSSGALNWIDSWPWIKRDASAGSNEITSLSMEASNGLASGKYPWVVEDQHAGSQVIVEVTDVHERKPGV